MEPRLSDFGRKLSAFSGINELMDDLGRALAEGGETIMMGGGNPALIPDVQAVWRRRLGEILDAGGELERMLGLYDTPRGNLKFLRTLAGFLRETCGWDVTERNIAVSSGSQTAYFILLNMLGGRDGDRFGRVVFPLVPEYVGYADQCIWPGVFRGVRPRIELHGEHRFKYHIDFDALHLDADTAAVCISRPTNPSANLVDDEEIRRLGDAAREGGTLLMIDSAYGAPVPGIVFREVKPYWDRHVIATFSLSKLGLPASRTGIVVADEGIIDRFAAVNAVVGLAPGGIGQAIVEPLLASREILELCHLHVQPFYLHRSRQTLAWIDEAFAARAPGVAYRVHESEGALFLWLWVEGLPIPSRELYQRLKARGVLVVPGEYFFPGIDCSAWPHSRQCVRLTYAQDPAAVQRGVGILAETAKEAMSVR